MTKKAKRKRITKEEGKNKYKMNSFQTGFGQNTLEYFLLYIVEHSESSIEFIKS